MRTYDVATRIGTLLSNAGIALLWLTVLTGRRRVVSLTEPDGLKCQNGPVTNVQGEKLEEEGQAEASSNLG